MASSVSTLAQGSLLTGGALGSTLSSILAKSVQASLASPNPTPFSVLSLPSNPLGLSLNVGPLVATSKTSDKSSSASGAISNGALGSLSAIAPQVTAPLQAGAASLTSALATATNALSTGLAAASRSVTPSARRSRRSERRPPDPSGVSGVHSVVMSRDGKAYAYNYNRIVSELMVVEGLK